VIRSQFIQYSLVSLVVVVVAVTVEVNKFQALQRYLKYKAFLLVSYKYWVNLVHKKHEKKTTSIIELILKLLVVGS